MSQVANTIHLTKIKTMKIQKVLKRILKTVRTPDHQKTVLVKNTNTCSLFGMGKTQELLLSLKHSLRAMPLMNIFNKLKIVA